MVGTIKSIMGLMVSILMPSHPEDFDLIARRFALTSDTEVSAIENSWDLAREERMLLKVSVLVAGSKLVAGLAKKVFNKLTSS